MDETEATPHPRGVPYRVAVLTLTDPELIAAFEAARDAPVPETELRERADKLRDASYRSDSAHTGDWGWGGNDLRDADTPGGYLYEARREKHIAEQAAAQARAARTRAPGAALEADFDARLRDGRIIASWIDLTRPELGARDYPGEVASLIVPLQGGQARLGRGKPVLTDLRYRSAPSVQSPALTRDDPMPKVPSETAGIIRPPAGGWDLMGAAEALLPDLVRSILEQDEGERDAWLRHLSVDLARALMARDDLRITGEEADGGIGERRATLGRRFYPDNIACNTFVWFDIASNSITIRLPTGKEHRLEAVRVESEARAVAAPAELLAGTRRRGPRDLARLAPVLEVARTKIARGTLRQTAVKQAHKELHGQHPSAGEVKAYMRALEAGDKDK